MKRFAKYFGNDRSIALVVALLSTACSEAVTQNDEGNQAETDTAIALSTQDGNDAVIAANERGPSGCVTYSAFRRGLDTDGPMQSLPEVPAELADNCVTALRDNQIDVLSILAEGVAPDDPDGRSEFGAIPRFGGKAALTITLNARPGVGTVEAVRTDRWKRPVATDDGVTWRSVTVSSSTLDQNQLRSIMDTLEGEWRPEKPGASQTGWSGAVAAANWHLLNDGYHWLAETGAPDRRDARFVNLCKRADRVVFIRYLPKSDDVTNYRGVLGSDGRFTQLSVMEWNDDTGQKTGFAPSDTKWPDWLGKTPWRPVSDRVDAKSEAHGEAFGDGGCEAAFSAWK